MENTCTPPEASISVSDATYRYVDLPAMFDSALTRLPVVLRLLLENVIRNTQGEERQRAVNGVLRWLDTGTSEEEIAFQPNRVLMHDTTSTPALVDIAAMRDALAEAGADPAALNPVLPVDVSVDHSLAVEAYAQPDAAARNLRIEMRRNAERYRFLRWASNTLRGVRIHPPGTGIMHTINLEQLATVATVQTIDGARWLVPDTLIGTDSHTPMINGIGVLGWGVGGLEAQTVMFGMPVMQRIPDVIGVRLAGALPAGSSATDLALTVTKSCATSACRASLWSSSAPVLPCSRRASVPSSPTWRPSMARPRASSPWMRRRWRTCAQPAVRNTPLHRWRRCTAVPACGSTPTTRRAIPASLRST